MALCRATWVCFTQGAETLCSPTRVLKLSAAPLPFCVALSLSVHLHMHFYITALFFFSSSRISSVAVSRWHDSNSSHEHWTSTVWSTWVWPWALLGHICWPGAWAVIKAVVKPLSKSIWKGLIILFPWIVENTGKTVAHLEGFSTLTSRVQNSQCLWFEHGFILDHCFHLHL